MKKNVVFLFLGGAALVALSFLLSYFGEIMDGVRYAVLAVGIIALVAGVLVLAFMYFRPQKKLLQKGAEYRKKSAVLSLPEADFLSVLRSVVDVRRCEIFPQVCLNAVIDKLNASYRNELFRVADFCIADSATFEPLLLIELNDKSHEREDRRLRDEKVRAICDAARLPVVTFSLAEASDLRLVRDRIKRYVKVR